MTTGFKNKIVFFLVSILIAFIAMLVTFKVIQRSISPYISEPDIKKEFYDNFETISDVTEYIKNSPYSNVNITDVDYIYEEGEYGTWYVSDEVSGNGGKQKIEDNEIVNTLNALFRDDKYQVITKSGGTISFQLWSNFDMTKGFAYVADGGTPYQEFLTKYEKLDKENWYYYETDFNEWKRRR